MNIVIVEDEEHIRITLCDVLSLYGHKVFDFDNGQSALDYINTTQELIHLILSDINMPRLNGVELVKALQNQGNTIPITLTTGYASPALIDTALKLNVKILNKPINFHLLKDILDSLEEATLTQG